MTPHSFSTHELPITDQFDAWRSWYGSVFDSTPGEGAHQGFAAEISTWMLDGFTFSQVSAPAVNGIRTQAHIRRNPVDHWVVTLYTQGNTKLRMQTQSTSLESLLGVPFIVSLGYPITTNRRSSHHRIQFHLARDRFQAIAPILDSARGLSLSTPQGKLLADYMLLLERNLPNLAPEDAARLHDAVQAMIEACLAPSADRLAGADCQINLTLLARVKRVITKHLRSPSLGPDHLCREAELSRSQLYRLLEPEGGVARYIQKRRLSESFALLSDLSSTAPIGEIAEMLGFSDSSTFNRSFRREFGMTPSEVRAAAVELGPLSAMAGEGLDIDDFSHCLRSL